MSSANTVSIAKFNQNPLVTYLFNKYHLEIKKTNQVVIKSAAVKNVAATVKYDEMVNTIIPKLFETAHFANWYNVTRSWGVPITVIHGPIFIDAINAKAGCTDLIEATPIPEQVATWMDEVDTFNINALFELPKPIPWTEPIESFDIDLMFAKEIDEHKYDDYDLAWLFPVVKIEVDASSWIESTDSFDIDTMFALDVEEHKYDACSLEWLFTAPVEEVDEVEDKLYADYDLSWLFPVETAVAWMDEVEDFVIDSLFQLLEKNEMIPTLIKSMESVPEIEVLVESKALEDFFGDEPSTAISTIEEEQQVSSIFTFFASIYVKTIQWLVFT